jgi:hypothetical protein
VDGYGGLHVTRTHLRRGTCAWRLCRCRRDAKSQLIFSQPRMRTRIQFASNIAQEGKSRPSTRLSFLSGVHAKTSLRMRTSIQCGVTLPKRAKVVRALGCQILVVYISWLTKEGTRASPSGEGYFLRPLAPSPPPSSPSLSTAVPRDGSPSTQEKGIYWHAFKLARVRRWHALGMARLWELQALEMARV